MDPNAVVRGAQLTLVGAYRALQNPRLFNATVYKQAAVAVALGFVIRLVISAPVVVIRFTLWLLGLVVDLNSAAWVGAIISGVEFFEKSVLQLPLFFMSTMRFLTPAMDEMFMKSLEWVDHTYLVKHRSDDPSSLRALYYPNMRMYKTAEIAPQLRSRGKKTPRTAVARFMQRSAKRAGISFLVYLLTFLPYVGRFVLPAASFYTFNRAVGPAPAFVVFGSGFIMSKKWMVMFIQGFFASRNLMRELLEPYFSRIKYTNEQKKMWFRERQGLLFGFGVGFYLILRIPILGILIYGIAEASTAFLITKITDPPPPPSQSAGFAETQVKWKNKHDFLKLKVHELDRYNVHLQ